MPDQALVVIDIQNDITPHYRDIVDALNAAVDWAAGRGMEVVYITHHDLSPGDHGFRPGTRGAELAPELKRVSDHIFVKTAEDALTSRDFTAFIREKNLREFWVTGADASACVKATCRSMREAGYTVHVISDCVACYEPGLIPEMLNSYAAAGCEVQPLHAYLTRTK